MYTKMICIYERTDVCVCVLCVPRLCVCVCVATRAYVHSTHICRCQCQHLLPNKTFGTIFTENKDIYYIAYVQMHIYSLSLSRIHTGSTRIRALSLKCTHTGAKIL